MSLSEKKKLTCFSQVFVVMAVEQRDRKAEAVLFSKHKIVQRVYKENIKSVPDLNASSGVGDMILSNRMAGIVC